MRWSAQLVRGNTRPLPPLAQNPEQFRDPCGPHGSAPSGGPRRAIVTRGQQNLPRPSAVGRSTQGEEGSGPSPATAQTSALTESVRNLFDSPAKQRGLRSGILHRRRCMMVSRGQLNARQAASSRRSLRHLPHSGSINPERGCSTRRGQNVSKYGSSWRPSVAHHNLLHRSFDVSLCAAAPAGKSRRPTTRRNGSLGVHQHQDFRAAVRFG